VYLGGNVVAIIPAYNEEKKIISTITKLPNLVDLVIIVDDGSKDRTSDILKKFDGCKKCVILSHKANLGKGEALKTSFRWLKSNKYALLLKNTAIVLIDADGQMHPDYFINMIEPILTNKYDFVKSTRFHPSLDIHVMPLFRRIGNRILRILNKISTGIWNITDPQSGYFAMSGNSLSTLDFERLDSGYFVENSMLYLLGLNRSIVYEVPAPAIYEEDYASSIKYKSFIPQTAGKLFLNWYKRIGLTSSQSLLRLISFICLVLFSFYGVYTIVYLISGRWSHLYFILFSILFIFSIICDYLDYVRRM